jgi:copper chaperone
VTTSTYAVAGMTCEHCTAAVTGELAKLAGVRDVSVELVAGGASRVRVLSDAPLDPAEVADAVDEAGYELAAGRP